MSGLDKRVVSRRVAVRVLTRVLSDRIALDEALESAIQEVPSDMAGWLQDVCSGTIRWKGRLDSVIDSVAMKKKPSGWLRKALLVASYQLVAQDRAQPGAVVSETVSAIKSKEGEAPAKFANACLRKVAEYATRWRNQAFPKGQTTAVEAAWASLPEWLWKKLLQEQGQEWAMAYSQASLERPMLWLRSRNLTWNAEWVEPGPVAYSWKSLQGGNITGKPGFIEGDFIVQDISSQLLIQEVSDQIRQDRGQGSLSAFDLCAAPGGKSVGLAWNGMRVTATERSEKRVLLLNQTIARTKADIQVFAWKDQSSITDQDLVWVDAPCSGTGILRRHPDIRWMRQEKELEELIKTQRELLQLGWEKVVPGGYLVYSVCSVLKEEGPDAIEKVDLPGAVVMKRWFLSPQMAPHGDGFWAALLKKDQKK